MIKAVQQTTGLTRGELERLRVRVGCLLAALEEAAEEIAPPVPGALLPPVDLCESEEAVTVQVELPGVTAEFLEVSLTSTHLRIAGKKKKGALRGRIAHLCSERSYGNFSRIIALRWPVRISHATAHLRQGVLIVRLPKLKDRRGAEFRITVTGEE
jgi:HSP20 family protein